MSLPVSASLSLSETARFVLERSGETEERVCAALTEAALAGEIVATGCRHLSALDPSRTPRYYDAYFGHAALSNSERVPPWAWATAISWQKSRVGRYDLVRFERANIERWLAPPATDRQSGSVAEIKASELQTTPSGIRTNKAEAAEAACGEWIATLSERPESKDTAFKAAVSACSHVGPLSRKAFDRAWAKSAPDEWKGAGRRKRRS